MKILTLNSDTKSMQILDKHGRLKIKIYTHEIKAKNHSISSFSCENLLQNQFSYQYLHLLVYVRSKNNLNPEMEEGPKNVCIF